MKKYILFFALTLPLPFLSYAQSVEELEKRNGFQDIKMASKVSDYEGLEYKKDVKDDIFPEAQLYVAKKGFYENIGELKIFDLEVKAYKGEVFEIKVVTEKDPKLYKGLKQIYGEPEYNYRSAVSQWTSKSIRMTYASESKNKMVLTYYSYVMMDKLKKEKEETIDAISDDF